MRSATYMGAPCKRGHSGERYTNNRTCVFCHQKTKCASYRKTRGINTYRGAPCKKYGHIGERYSSNGHCIVCHKMRKLRGTQPRGPKRTYQGPPCKYGHDEGIRYNCNNRCVICDKLDNQAQAEYNRLYHQAWRQRRSPEQILKDRERVKKWRLKNDNAHRPDVINAANDRAIEQAAVRYNTMAMLYYPQEADQYSVHRVAVPISDDDINYQVKSPRRR